MSVGSWYEVKKHVRRGAQRGRKMDVMSGMVSN